MGKKLIKTEQEFRDFLGSNSKARFFSLNPLLKLSEGFIEEFMGRLGNVNIFNYFKPSDLFIEKHFVSLMKSWNLLFNVKINEVILDKFSNLIGEWHTVSYRQNLSEAFIEKYADKVHWEYIFTHQTLSVPFLEKWGYKIPYNNFWLMISQNQKLPIEFIRKNRDLIHWSNIAKNLTVEVAREFGDLIQWRDINYYSDQNSFTEEFLNEFGHCLDLKRLFKAIRYNKTIFSEAFLEKNLKKIPLNVIWASQSISPDFILRHSKKFTKTSKGLILQNENIKKDMEFYEKLGHLFQFSSIPFSDEALREIIRKNVYKFDMNKFIADGESNVLKGMAGYLLA